MKYNIVAFDSLPDVLKKSDYVDFLLPELFIKRQ